MLLLTFFAGLVLLVVGAEALVKGASKLAAALGIPPLIIGLTVVAFGTSAPELAVSIKSALANQANLAVGNVIGSNIFNVLFILGLAALITPLVVSQQLVRLDVPIMTAVSVLVLVFGLDGNLSRIEGILLFSGLISYTVMLIFLSRKENKAVQNEYAEAYGGQRSTGRDSLINVGWVLGGLVLLVLGSGWLVESAVAMATHFGVSELIIGLTVIAAGTSLPELVTSIIAGIRGERDIAVGNVVGSNLFNILGVLGLSSIIAPSGIEISDPVLRFDLPVMIVVAVACLPIFFSGNVITRWEGGLFLGYYVAYTLYLILGATHHETLPMFSWAMLYFVIPLTIITLGVVSIRAFRNKGRSNTTGIV